MRFGHRLGGLLAGFCGAAGLWGAAPLIDAGPRADTLPITTLPGEPVTRTVRNLQRKADRAFERGDYGRAHRLYLNKLAPRGDKHAHYMIGILNEHGLGVPRDPVRAVAWYSVAAERGATEAGVVGARLLETLSATEREQADELFAELLARYGDWRLHVEAVRRDMRELRRRTGSYLGSYSGPMLVAFPSNSFRGLETGEQFYGALEARIEARLQLLGGNVTLGQFELIDTPEEASADGEEP